MLLKMFLVTMKLRVGASPSKNLLAEAVVALPLLKGFVFSIAVEAAVRSPLASVAARKSSRYLAAHLELLLFVLM